MRYIRSCFIFSTLLLGVQLRAGALDLKQIDREVQSIEEGSVKYVQTSEKVCEEHNCTIWTYYWDENKRLKKIKEAFESEVDPSCVQDRFYSNCQLIFTRVTSMAKKDALPEKYYFQKGKIIQIIFNNIAQHFEREQIAYYERTYGGAPKTCIMKEKGA